MSDFADVFLSFHTGSSTETVKTLVKHLNEAEITTWTCLDLPPGDLFRDSIVKSIKGCKVFIMVINKQWAESGECEEEFYYAKRLNAKNRPRLPMLLPIVFPNLEVSDFPQVESLQAKVQMLQSKFPEIRLDRDKALLAEITTTVKKFLSGDQTYDAIAPSLPLSESSSNQLPSIAVWIDRVSRADEIFKIERQTGVEILYRHSDKDVLEIFRQEGPGAIALISNLSRRDTTSKNVDVEVGLKFLQLIRSNFPYLPIFITGNTKSSRRSKETCNTLDKLGTTFIGEGNDKVRNLSLVLKSLHLFRAHLSM
eukprot:Lithocolla_globosa_v1_NODE_3845_length_1566_cov_2.780940.p1 type:complete len:310 gc:universal NODE_3845_length_1566_cov_2.780940:1111-182(-)